jgi:hypothetical protein
MVNGCGYLHIDNSLPLVCSFLSDLQFFDSYVVAKVFLDSTYCSMVIALLCISSRVIITNWRITSLKEKGVSPSPVNIFF